MVRAKWGGEGALLVPWDGIAENPNSNHKSERIVFVWNRIKRNMNTALLH